MSDETRSDANAAAEIPAPAPVDVGMVATAGAAAIERLKAPDLLPPNERVLFTIQRALGRDYAEPHQVEAAEAIRDFSRVTSELLRDFQYEALGRAIAQFWRRMASLESRDVLPPRTEREQWEVCILHSVYTFEGRNVSYVPAEVDSLWRALEPGERIVSFNMSGIQTTARTISRRELRLGAAPRFKVALPDWNAEQFLRNFPALALSDYQGAKE